MFLVKSIDSIDLSRGGSEKLRLPSLSGGDKEGFGKLSRSLTDTFLTCSGPGHGLVYC